MATSTNSGTLRERGPGTHSAPGPPSTAAFEHAAEVLPMLHTPGAWPVVRDRWERLVTVLQIAAPVADVWPALTEPAAIGHWLAACHGEPSRDGAEWTLDFEDGEFFLCRAIAVEPPGKEGRGRLEYAWRWLGIGQPTRVRWDLEAGGGGDTTVTVTEEAFNPPADWQTWNGGGWPGILDQLAAYLRTGTEWRWPWRRMGPYAQIELAASPFEAWDQLMSEGAVRYWLQRMGGALAVGHTLTILMGDASGTVDMDVREIVEPGESPPSFLPHITFALRRGAWESEVGGRLWIEPAGWGRSLLQVFHYNWESLPAPLQLPERRIVTSFWAGAMRRAAQLFTQPSPTGPHGWS